MFTNTFTEATEIIHKYTEIELSEPVAFAVKSADGKHFLINRLYNEAFEIVLQHLTSPDGICALTVSANKSTKSDIAGSPRLIPTSKDEREHGPEISFPLGRIIWRASGGDQVQRKETGDDFAFDWTVQNTYLAGGKQDNQNTREAFLKYIHKKLIERIGEKEALEVRNLISDRLVVADAVHRPSSVEHEGHSLTTVETQHIQ